MLEHRFAAIAVERIAIHEWLRHGLDGEGVLGVADGVYLSIDRGDGDSEQRGVNLAELGDVVGRLTASQSRYSAVQLSKIILDRRKRGRFRAHDGLRAKRLVHASSPSPRVPMRLNIIRRNWHCTPMT